MTEREAIEMLEEELRYSVYANDKSWRAYHIVKEAIDKYSLLERALSAFLGQSGECDDYIGCLVYNPKTEQYAQTGEIVRSADGLINWYTENFPEEMKND